MSLWLVPVALLAVGAGAVVVMTLRVVAEVALLRAEMARVANLRPALVDLAGEADALHLSLERARRRS